MPRTATTTGRPNGFVRGSLCVASLFLALLRPSFIHGHEAQAAPGEPASLLPGQQTQQITPATLLEPSVKLDRQLAGVQKQIYEVELAQGQFAAVAVDCQGISATIRLRDAAGETISEDHAYADSPSKKTVDMVAEQKGRCRLEIEGNSPEAPPKPYSIQLIETRPATEKELWRHQARRLSFKANELIEAVNYPEARKAAEMALALREKALGPDHIGVGNALLMLANILWAEGDYPAAEPHMLRSLAINEKTFGAQSAGAGRVLNNLGVLYLEIGEVDKAEQSLQRALEIQEKLTGPDHSLITATLQNLAELSLMKGDYGTAESRLERALAMNEAMGPDNKETSTALLNLGNLYQNRGDYEKAEKFLQRSLTLKEKAGTENAELGDVLSNLGYLRYLAGELEKAETLDQRALQIYEKVLGPDHPRVALMLNDIAEIYRDRRDFARAETLNRRALEIQEKKLGDTHFDLGPTLNNLGNLYRDQGDYDRAWPFYKRALVIQEKALGPDHHKVVGTLADTALLHMARGNYAEAEALQSRAIAITERNADLNLLSGSERQKLAYLDLLSEQLHRAITLNVSLAPDQPAARDLAVTTVLQRKGRVQDALSDSLAVLRQRLGSEDVKLLDRLRSTTSQLAHLALGGPTQLSDEAHQARFNAHKEQREQLEAEISRHSAEFRLRSEPVTIAAVRGALPANAALLEFIAYKRFLPRGTSKERFGESRYAVYIIRGQGDVQWRELGETKAIDEAIDELRKALRDPKRQDAQQLARVVDERVMQPIRPLLGETTQLLISPDGHLNLIPFEALVDKENRYVVEQFSCTYLTSGRDLLRLQVKRETKTDPIVIANPLFGEPGLRVSKADLPRLQRTASRQKRSDGIKRQSVTTGPDIADVYFAPLEDTAREAQVIKSLFTQTGVLTGTHATEASLKQVRAPRILHIATHGFFLTDTSSSSSADGEKTRSINAKAKIENPLLRSGLALAGANLRKESDDDGILTALEAPGLNLWGTKLVTLSACDTGIGEVKNGEGVYGLRRAFVLAGTETLVMSMWPVSDFVTRELMTAYYQGLKQGQGRGEALRQVKLNMLKRQDRRHPFYWASFIQSGEWANLDGKR